MILLGALLVCAPKAATAEDEPNISSARDHFGRAVEFYRDGNYEAALADFDRAYELAPHWGLLYNIGLAHAALLNYPAAVDALERHLREGADEVPVTRRSQLERELRRLESLIGRLVITFEGPAAVALYIDGIERATSPFADPITVAAGRRRVEVRADSFLPFRREVIVAGGVEVELSVELVRAPAQSGVIIVELDVPGAEITLDGEAVGTSPLDRPIVADPGRHVLEAARPGYETAGRVVEVELGEFLTVEISLTRRADLPRELSGRLELRIPEDDAEVFLDGVPLEDGPLPIGAHLLEVRLAGFESWWREIDIGNESSVIEADLRPTAAYLDRYLDRARRWRLAAWLTTAIGAAVLATDLGLYLWNRSRHVEWVSDAAFLVQDAVATPPTLTAEESRQGYEDAQALGRELENWSFALAIAAGVGTAAVIAGIALFGTGPNPHRYDRFNLSATPEGIMIAYSGRFH